MGGAGVPASTLSLPLAGGRGVPRAALRHTPPSLLLAPVPVPQLPRPPAVAAAVAVQLLFPAVAVQLLLPAVAVVAVVVVIVRVRPAAVVAENKFFNDEIFLPQIFAVLLVLGDGERQHNS